MGRSGETGAAKVNREIVSVTTVYGSMFAFSDDLVTRQIRDFGTHTRPEVAFLLSVVREGDRVFDIGAHIGTFTVPLAQKVGPAGAVVAVEGAIDTYDVAVRNVEVNGLADRVVLRN